MNEASSRFDPRLAGASAEAVRRHYDVGNDFFRLWLGPTMTYSCALWCGDQGESLETAQLRKLDAHLENAGARGQPRLLDVGCGWGSLLERALECHGVREATGLTLSRSQHDWIVSRSIPGVEARLESWVDHCPRDQYDAIVSICAIEAFTKRGLASRDKVEVYRAFFSRCKQWLKPRGGLSLQCIVYGKAGPEQFSDFIAEEIFPETDLPRPAELFEGFERIFEPIEVRNDRAHYVRTLEAWSARLRENRSDAVAIAGEEVVVRFQRYLKLSAHMFMEGACDLFRVHLRPS